jgi:hypothetical protein
MTDEEKKKIPDYPELEAGNHVAQTEAQIAEAQRNAELLEKRAKRDRDMAIFGDMANLVAKGAAMHGGAWKINNDELQSAKANERLRALQQKNAAQMAEYAKMRVAAEDNERKERNAMKKAQYDADVEAYKRAVEAEKYAKGLEYKDAEEKRKEALNKSNIARNKAYEAYYLAGGTKKQYPMEVLGVRFDANNDADVANAYHELVKRGMAKAQKVDRKWVTRGRSGGKWEISEPYDIDYPSTEEMLEQIRWFASQQGTKAAEGVTTKKANPMGGGKKTNPMN